MSQSNENKAIQGFNIINKRLIELGFKPLYNNYDEYITTNGFSSHNEALQQIKQYIKELKEYNNNNNLNVIQDLTILNNDNLNSKTDFLSNKMSNAYKSINDFNPIPRLTKDQRLAQQKEIFNKKQAAFPSLYNITKEGLSVSHNPNYLRKDYFDDVIKVKHPEWERYTDLDIDGDNESDIAIYSKARNLESRRANPTTDLKYYNGWGISKNKLARPYVDYLIKNPNADQSYRFGYLPQRPEHKVHEPIIDIEETFKDFVDKIVKALGTITPRLRMIMSQFGFKQKLKSMLNRFVILPFALTKLKYNPEEFKPVLFSDAAFTSNKKLMSMYRSKKIRKVWKEQGVEVIEGSIKNVEDTILALANQDPATFVELVVKGDNKIRDIFYNDAVQQALNSMEED